MDQYPLIIAIRDTSEPDRYEHKITKLEYDQYQ